MAAVIETVAYLTDKIVIHSETVSKNPDAFVVLGWLNGCRNRLHSVVDKELSASKTAIQAKNIFVNIKILAEKDSSYCYESLLAKAKSELNKKNAEELKQLEQHPRFHSWWSLMKTQYPMIQDEETDEFVVYSEAKDWNQERCWRFEYKTDAYRKIFQLVAWCDEARDRGFGDRYKDVQRLLSQETQPIKRKISSRRAASIA